MIDQTIGANGWTIYVAFWFGLLSIEQQEMHPLGHRTLTYAYFEANSHVFFCIFGPSPIFNQTIYGFCLFYMLYYVNEDWRYIQQLFVVIVMFYIIEGFFGEEKWAQQQWPNPLFSLSLSFSHSCNYTLLFRVQVKWVCQLINNPWFFALVQSLVSKEE